MNQITRIKSHQLALTLGSLIFTIAVAITLLTPHTTASKQARHGGGFIPGANAPRVVASAPQTASSWSLSRYITRYHDQGSSNTCVAQTLSTMEEITQSERGHRLSFSPGFIFNQKPDRNPNTGMTYQDAFWTLVNEGDATIHDFTPDGINDPYTQPNRNTLRAAYPYHFVQWRSISPYDVGTMEAEIHAGRPIAVAIPVYDSFLNKNDSSTVDSEWGNYQFQHSITGIGYSPVGLLILNSWGYGWGYHGEATLSWRFLASVNATVAVALPLPAPKPKPRPKPFPRAKWGKLSPYYCTRPHHCTLSWAASIWTHHQWLGHALDYGHYYGTGRGAYTKIRFQHGHIFTFAGYHTFKVTR